MAIPKDIRINLANEDIPKKWYNFASDVPDLAPPLNPGTREPAKPSDFEPIFCKEIIRQEGSTEGGSTSPRRSGRHSSASTDPHPSRGHTGSRRP